MTEPEQVPEGAVTRSDVARGAGLAGLARAGALIEAVGEATYTAAASATPPV